MIILGILLFALLVVVHELGHFWLARRNGVEVEEFGIGFPPKLYGRRRGSTEYTLNLIPLGGFVKLKGESDEANEPGSFGASRLLVKAKILLAGVGMNVAASIAIIFILALTSLPQIVPNQFSISQNETIRSEEVVAASVVSGSAADEAGLQRGDYILRIDQTEVKTATALREITQQLSGREVEVVIERAGEQSTKTVQLSSDDENGYLGVGPADLSTSRYSWAAPLVAIGVTVQMIWLVVSALFNVFVELFQGAGGAAADQLTGPVGVVYLLQNLGDLGLEYLLFLMASISVSLAVFNALPIPALDGGRLAVIAGARLLRKPLKPEVENAIHGIGFMLLIGVFILITYIDVQRFF